jgi:hypothetical protein
VRSRIVSRGRRDAVSQHLTAVRSQLCLLAVSSSLVTLVPLRSVLLPDEGLTLGLLGNRAVCRQAVPRDRYGASQISAYRGITLATAIKLERTDPSEELPACHRGEPACAQFGFEIK